MTSGERPRSSSRTSSTARRSGVSRRALLGGGAALGVALPAATLAGPAHADEGTSSAASAERALRKSADSALTFLQRVTDAHRTSGARLAQSYQDDAGLKDMAFVYDNAVALIALLSQGDVSRARAIGDALLYAQTHDGEFEDHRLRQAYHSDSFANAAGKAVPGHEFALTGSASGDMAWCGIALAQLAKKTGDSRYAVGALWIGRWIYDTTYSESGLGGYSFGDTAGLSSHKSTEHNVDVYAFFRLLESLTGDPRWTERAGHAKEFVEALWDDHNRHFWTGSDDGVAINKAAAQLPASPQSRSWLALRDKDFIGALDWVSGSLATTDTPLRRNSRLADRVAISGIAFGSGSLTADQNAAIAGKDENPRPDIAAVWLEGTAQLALALATRKGGGDREAADQLLGQLKIAQQRLAQDQKFGGKTITGGLVSATSPTDTGFGFGYYSNLHIGATAWYVLAVSGTNPYVFL